MSRRKNIFEKGVESTLYKLLGVWRLGKLAPSFLFHFFFGKLIPNGGLRFSELYYYYQVLLNGRGIHLDENSNSFVFKSFGYRIIARKGAHTSDLENFNQIFGREEYHQAVRIFSDNFSCQPNLIFDIGANVGFATLYFRRQFSKSRIYAVEPDSFNFQSLQSNVDSNRIKDVWLTNAGVWSKDTFLIYDSPQETSKTWAFTFRESSEETGIYALDFYRFVEERRLGDLIDILKIDIEGTEGVLFANEGPMSRLLKSVRLIAVEIHDHMVDRGQIEALMISNGFLLSSDGDMTYGVNTGLIKTTAS